jgi:hypothetical protein
MTPLNTDCNTCLHAVICRARRYSSVFPNRLPPIPAEPRQRTNDAATSFLYNDVGLIRRVLTLLYPYSGLVLRDSISSTANSNFRVDVDGETDTMVAVEQTLL